MAHFNRAFRQFSTAARTGLRAARASGVQPVQATFSRRAYSSAAGASQTAGKSGGSGGLIALLGLAGVGGGGYYYYSYCDGSATAKDFKPTTADYQNVYNEIARLIEEKDDYDDGSYAPVLLRLAWHASGTYDKESGTGGSNGATMRFTAEASHGANAGLAAARDFLEPVKKMFPWISYGDLWTLAGVCAIQEMQGPTVPWRPGRQDLTEQFVTPDGRLPDAAQGAGHLRNIFYRMGFNDQEIVALAGAHALGRCHTDRSGYDGPWTFSPTVMSNDFYRLLMDEKWNLRKWSGPAQFQDKGSKSLMMLPTDMSLVQDKKFKVWVEKYAADADVFFRDFSTVVVRLFELGVPFQSKEEDRIRFKPRND